MILICSRGHEYDTERWPWWSHLRPGKRCPAELNYDRMTGSTYCRRVLKEKKEEKVTEIAPQELMNSYRAELARLYGERIASATHLHYCRGWFYLRLAERFHDGSVGVIGRPVPYRRKALLEMRENLRKRDAKREDPSGIDRGPGLG